MGKIRYNYYRHIVRKAKLTNTMLNRKIKSPTESINYNLPIQLNSKFQKLLNAKILIDTRTMKYKRIERNNKNIFYAKFYQIKKGLYYEKH